MYSPCMAKRGKRKLHETPAEFARAANRHNMARWKEKDDIARDTHAFWANVQMPAHQPKLPREFKRKFDPHVRRHSW